VRLADELLADEAVSRPIPHHISPLFDLAWVLADLERSKELTERLEKEAIRTPYTDAAESLTRGDYERAADRYASVGARPNEAYTRLRAAAQHMDAGRRAEAEVQLSMALEFWQTVGAARYVRQGETVASSSANDELRRQELGT
jgi:hypothetical protein